MEIEIENLLKHLRNTDPAIEQIFTMGGCFALYEFLKKIYTEAEPYIDKDGSHVITKLGGSYFDITGEVSKVAFRKLTKEDEAECKKWGFFKKHYTTKECEFCGEMIKI